MRSNGNESSSLKPVRSYVRREGRITPAQEKALSTLWSKYGICDDDSVVDISRLFDRVRSITLEIGFGNGENLVNLALQNPGRGYIGIDVYRPGAGRLLLQLERRNISNVRVLLKDAVEAIRTQIQESSMDSILIYFPDPWPKKKHHKRRLLQIDFLRQLALRLRHSGTLHIATDWENYAHNILDLIDQEPLLENVSGTKCYSNQSQFRILTKYEARGIHLGHQVHEILARRL